MNQAKQEFIEEMERLEAENERLRRDKDNLRKAVTWLVGALHDESPYHAGKPDAARPPQLECEVWECRRARDRLSETASEDKAVEEER